MKTKKTSRRKSLAALIKKAIEIFQNRLDKEGVDTARRADELAAEVAGEVGAGRSENEQEAILTALCEQASKEFPGDW